MLYAICYEEMHRKSYDSGFQISQCTHPRKYPDKQSPYNIKIENETKTNAQYI